MTNAAYDEEDACDEDWLDDDEEDPVLCIDDICRNNGLCVWECWK